MSKKDVAAAATAKAAANEEADNAAIAEAINKNKVATRSPSAFSLTGVFQPLTNALMTAMRNLMKYGLNEKGRKAVIEKFRRTFPQLEVSGTASILNAFGWNNTCAIESILTAVGLDPTKDAIISVFTIIRNVCDALLAITNEDKGIKEIIYGGIRASGPFTTETHTRASITSLRSQCDDVINGKPHNFGLEFITPLLFLILFDIPIVSSMTTLNGNFAPHYFRQGGGPDAKSLYMNFVGANAHFGVIFLSGRVPPMSFTIQIAKRFAELLKGGVAAADAIIIEKMKLKSLNKGSPGKDSQAPAPASLLPAVMGSPVTPITLNSTDSSFEPSPTESVSSDVRPVDIAEAKRELEASQSQITAALSNAAVSLQGRVAVAGEGNLPADKHFAPDEGARSKSVPTSHGNVEIIKGVLSSPNATPSNSTRFSRNGFRMAAPPVASRSSSAHNTRSSSRAAKTQPPATQPLAGGPTAAGTRQ